MNAYDRSCHFYFYFYFCVRVFLTPTNNYLRNTVDCGSSMWSRHLHSCDCSECLALKCVRPCHEVTTNNVPRDRALNQLLSFLCSRSDSLITIHASPVVERDPAVLDETGERFLVVRSGKLRVQCSCSPSIAFPQIVSVNNFPLLCL